MKKYMLLFLIILLAGCTDNSSTSTKKQQDLICYSLEGIEDVCIKSYKLEDIRKVKINPPKNELERIMLSKIVEDSFKNNKAMQKSIESAVKMMLENNVTAEDLRKEWQAQKKEVN